MLESNVEGKPKKKRAMKKIDKNSKVFKYFMARKKGKNKTESSIVAGYSHPNNVDKVEATVQFQALERHYKDKLQDVISMEEIANAHADNIRQDMDRGARNKAIEMALSKLEPDKIKEEDDDRIVVILKQP